MVSERLVRQNLPMTSAREPGWHLEPGSDRVERYWNIGGPTDDVRSRPSHQLPPPAPVPGRDEREQQHSDPVDVEFDTGAHPYRKGGLRWWIQADPFIGRFYAPFFHRKRVEAENRGELKPDSIRWRIASLVATAALVATVLLWDKVFGVAAP